MKIKYRARPDCPLSRRRAEYTVAGRRIGVLLFWLLLSIDWFLQFLQPENQEWLSTFTKVGEQTLESNNMCNEESDFE